MSTLIFGSSMEIVWLDASSVIEYAAYDRDKHFLRLGFKSGKEYKYFDVPRTIFVNLCEAESAGKYFNTAIRGAYEHELLAA